MIYFYFFLKGRKKIREYFRISWKKKFWFFWHGNWNLQNKKRIWFHHTYSNVELAIMSMLWDKDYIQKKNDHHTSLSLSLFSLSFCLLLYHHNLEQAQNIHCFIPFVCPSLVYDWTGLWVLFLTSSLSQHVGQGSKVFSGILNGGLMISVPLCWPVIYFFSWQILSLFLTQKICKGFGKGKFWVFFFFLLKFKFN